MKEREPTIKINVEPEEKADFSKTTPVSRKAVFENIDVIRHAYLEISHPELETTTVKIDEKDVLIGRGSQCRVNLQFGNTSRLHARITCRDEEYQIEDLESTNGTFVNGVRIQRCVLRNSDQIQIGDAKIVFVEEKFRKD
jgi:pSer/pThr/pTyr-binding forkhead associated (FHA) protein